MLSIHVLQFSALLALNFQFQGLKMTYKMFAHRNNMILASFLSSRQNKLQMKRKHALARQLRRKARSVWFQKGRTDLWWQNMLGENATDSNWKKNFRMTRDCFMKFSPIRSIHCSKTWFLQSPSAFNREEASHNVILPSCWCFGANCTQNARAQTIFSARAGKICDYMRNLSPFTRAENPSPPSSRRAEIPARAENFSCNRKISFTNR